MTCFGLPLLLLLLYFLPSFVAVTNSHPLPLLLRKVIYFIIIPSPVKCDYVEEPASHPSIHPDHPPVSPFILRSRADIYF